MAMISRFACIPLWGRVRRILGELSLVYPVVVSVFKNLIQLESIHLTRHDEFEFALSIRQPSTSGVCV
jgi:hypothetical protein